MGGWSHIVLQIELHGPALVLMGMEIKRFLLVFQKYM